MENMAIYNAVREVPANAKKQISAGRLKGMTDISPMWRIKKLTEQFGTCGFGWKYEVKDKRLERGAKDEVAAFVDVDLYVCVDGKWSAPIPGTGGSSFVTLEKSGLHTSDECFKMALTDALSVACKALGMGADVYWDGDKTKYTKQGEPTADKPAPNKATPICQCCGKPIKPVKKKSGEMWESADMASYSQRRYGTPMCYDCMKVARQEE